MKALSIFGIIILIILCAVLVLGSLITLYMAGVFTALGVLFLACCGISALVNVYSKLVRT